MELTKCIGALAKTEVGNIHKGCVWAGPIARLFSAVCYCQIGISTSVMKSPLILSCSPMKRLRRTWLMVICHLQSFTCFYTIPFLVNFLSSPNGSKIMVLFNWEIWNTKKTYYTTVHMFFTSMWMLMAPQIYKFFWKFCWFRINRNQFINKFYMIIIYWI